MLRKGISDEEVKKRIKEFLHKNRKYYTEEEIQFLIKNATWGRYKHFVCAELRQIYDYLGLLQEDNIHTAFMKMIERHFPDAQRIIDVGCGIVPSLSARLAEKYHLTVYDPRVIRELYDESKFCIKKERFTKDTNIKNADLLVGFMPNGAHSAIVDSAIKNDTDFIIAMSNLADEKEEIYDIVGYKKYEIARKIEKSSLGELWEDSLEAYDNEYPVVYNKRQSKNGQI